MMLSLCGRNLDSSSSGASSKADTTSAPAAPTPEDDAERRKKDEGVARAQLLAQALKKSMRDPDSFKLEQALVISDTNAVCMEYRARNGFGGMNVGYAVMSGDGKNIKTDEMDGFRRLWNRECKGKTGQDVATAINWFAL